LVECKKKKSSLNCSFLIIGLRWSTELYKRKSKCFDFGTAWVASWMYNSIPFSSSLRLLIWCLWLISSIFHRYFKMFTWNEKICELFIFPCTILLYTFVQLLPRVYLVLYLEYKSLQYKCLFLKTFILNALNPVVLFI
jgi:hypothetical protein